MCVILSACQDTNYLAQLAATAVAIIPGLAKRQCAKVSRRYFLFLMGLYPNRNWEILTLMTISSCLFLLAVIHCPVPVPDNGFVYSPCRTEFNSKCVVGCAYGYLIEGTSRITCDASGIWEPRNVSCKGKWLRIWDLILLALRHS